MSWASKLSEDCRPAKARSLMASKLEPSFSAYIANSSDKMLDRSSGPGIAPSASRRSEWRTSSASSISPYDNTRIIMAAPVAADNLD